MKFGGKSSDAEDVLNGVPVNLNLKVNNEENQRKNVTEIVQVKLHIKYSMQLLDI